jgi:tRNA-2-methylthio-N6-dimethylallyladenosine synthase
MKLDNLIIDNSVTVSNPVLKFENSISDKLVYIETYGCQMNFSDTEIIWSLLLSNGFRETADINNADVIFLNTCSVRENAERKIFNKLTHLKKYKKSKPDLIIGILGCMAERLRKSLIDDYNLVDLVIGPDEYRKLPSLLNNKIETGETGIAVRLSKIETYDDIIPVRKKGISAWVTVMRGCDKFCSFCIVPFTRGRERSRLLKNIVNEVKLLEQDGVKDIWLLGQNVNSYRDGKNDFSDLLSECAVNVPLVRIRFITSHPYDLSEKLLETIAAHKNICKYIHLPVQSGSDRILKLMNRLYTVKQYTGIIEKARNLMNEISFSTDIIAGFPTEKEEDHKMTLDIMKQIEFDSAFMFAYSPRENTKSYSLADDVEIKIKKRRLEEIIELQKEISLKSLTKFTGKTKEILIESFSKKSKDNYMGRTDCNKPVIISVNNNAKNKIKIGDFVNVRINKVNSATLFGEPVD